MEAMLDAHKTAHPTGGASRCEICLTPIVGSQVIQHAADPDTCVNTGCMPELCLHRLAFSRASSAKDNNACRDTLSAQSPIYSCHYFFCSTRSFYGADMSRKMGHTRSEFKIIDGPQVGAELASDGSSVDVAARSELSADLLGHSTRAINQS